ncbi:LysR family transcriptional regulator [Vogesella sp. LIG4]|uniref:LysR family transcriptional regulator n=1 Tax=Vogesella sp. LIG4 TaxID=1192162 RepID=UPI000820216D|nr:LysR family transcriptional regulator [Vogesella sp. LIG4]SCK18512.1 DNA-binding transcriptional regulator, LysR family [Vogesella sp. LIG4]
MKRNLLDNLNGLQVFATVADSGSFTTTAERLGMTKANVSLHISRLETQLGVPLFTRTTRQVRLTDAGQALLAQAQPALLVLRDALQQVGRSDTALGGTLRLTAPIDHFMQSLSPAVTEFASLHPSLQLDLHTSDQVVDLVAEGIDVAIRLGALRDSSLRAVRLGEFEQRLVASPGYLRSHGVPDTPEQLAGHNWVAFTLMRTPLTWTFHAADGGLRTVRMQSRLRVDSSTSLRALLLQGAGISVLDHYSIRQDLAAGRLVHLLPQWSLPKGGLYAVLPPGRHTPPAARAFITFYRSFLARQGAAAESGAAS